MVALLFSAMKHKMDLRDLTKLRLIAKLCETQKDYSFIELQNKLTSERAKKISEVLISGEWNKEDKSINDIAFNLNESVNGNRYEV